MSVLKMAALRVAACSGAAKSAVSIGAARLLCTYSCQIPRYLKTVVYRSKASCEYFGCCM